LDRYYYLTIPEWITALAIIVGPVVAVWVTRFHDKRARNYNDKFDVFRALMKTRRARLDAEHVAALNLIEVVFYHENNIMEKYNQYYKHLATDLPAQNNHGSFLEERNGLFVSLVQAIGLKLGYQFDKFDLDRGAYFPVGWGNDQDRQQRNAVMFTELLEGKRSLPIFHMQYDQQKFPPKPE
jgi:uncharacterized membrane-anchored protein YhcB (DUF1043 family)